MSSKETSTRKNDLAKGHEVDCVVRRVEPFGVFVEVVGGKAAAGFIKRHAWDWSRRGSLVGRVWPGERVRAKIVGRRRNGDWQLDRRITLDDPFSAFRKNHSVGETVIGELSLLTSKAAGVRLLLEGGAEGFIPRSELPEAAQQLDGFGLVAQDRLAARILRYDDEQSVVLSVREHLRHRDSEDSKRRRVEKTTLRYHPTLGVQLEKLYWHYQLGEVEEPSLSPRVRERVRRVLVVEDSVDVSTSLRVVLRHFELECDVADSLDNARRRLAEADYDLLILDLDLSAERGAELLDEVGERATLALVFVLTAASVDDWRSLHDESREPPIVVLQKPTGVEEIFRLLERKLANGETLGASAAVETTVEEEPDAVSQPARVSWRGRRLLADRRQQVEEILGRLRQESGATHAFLLSRRPGPIFELEAGSFLELTREAQQSLAVSPIGSILEERRAEIHDDTEHRKAYFRHLAELWPLRSFAGVALDYEDQRRYGLFLLSASPHQFHGFGEQRLRSTAQTLGHLLAESRLDDALAENQGLLLTGFLSDSLLHEIKNELQTLDNHTTLQLLLARRHGDELSRLSAEEARDFTRSTAEIQKVSQRLNQLVVLFGNLAGRSPAERIDLNQTVRRLESTLRPYARKRSAVIDLELATDLPEILVNPRLVEQPLLNLMINGLEQMELRGAPSRRLRVTTRQRDDADFPLLVSVADTGPGIHRVEWEKIFDLFFTTKEKGTGLGLYLSRFFVEQFGGRLTLRESLMFSGSELVLEIPRGVVA